MDQTGESTQGGQKPKISKLAITSPLVFILCFLVGVVMAYQGGVIKDLGAVVLFVSPFAGLISGIIAGHKIKKSKGLLKGRVFSISGIVLSVIVFILFLAPPFIRPPRPSARVICASNMSWLGRAIFLYNNDYDSYPTKDAWCDLLIEYTDVDKELFVCNAALKQGDIGPCHYALNPNCSPNSPNDVVLLFETKGGWNQFGGPKLLTVENHKGEGCNILFNDIRVKFIEKEKLSELKWGNKPKDEPNQRRFLSSSYKKRFEDGFLVLGAYIISQNNSYRLERTEFNEVLNVVCEKAEKITDKQTVEQIEKDFDGKVEYVVMMRYAEFVDDRPAKIEITRDKILRCLNEYYMLGDDEYGLLTTFLDSSVK